MNSITTFMKRFQLVIFFTIAIATFYAGNLWKVKDPNSPWFLTIYGTGLGALLVVSLTEGWAGVKAWASRIVRWRVGWIWYVAAFSIPLILESVGIWLELCPGRAHLSCVRVKPVVLILTQVHTDHVGHRFGRRNRFSWLCPAQTDGKILATRCNPHPGSHARPLAYSALRYRRFVVGRSARHRWRFSLHLGLPQHARQRIDRHAVAQREQRLVDSGLWHILWFRCRTTHHARGIYVHGYDRADTHCRVAEV